MNIMFLGNGNTAAFDEDGVQIPEFQVGWINLYLQFLEKKGVDVTRVKFELVGFGSGSNVTVFKTEGGYNYQISDGNR